MTDRPAWGARTYQRALEGSTPSPANGSNVTEQLTLGFTGHDEIATISYDVAAPFIRRWHYSHSVPKGSHIFFGWYRTDGSLYAVADYGNGVNPHQWAYLRRVLDAPHLAMTSWTELKRLCRIDPKDESMPLTRFLSRCHRRLRREHDIKVVIAFSDPAHGHTGALYKAANFVHMGQTQQEWHVIDQSGIQQHRRLAYRYARRHGISIEQARQQLGLARVKTLRKDRWVIRLSSF